MPPNRSSLIAPLALFLGAINAGAATCESLASLKLPDTTITSAQSVGAGAFTMPSGGFTPSPISANSLPPFCRVSATLRPSQDSDIKIEVWLPAADWNGKFQGVGNGGWTGSISYDALMAALQRGYASASTDTGHAGGVVDGSFALGHPEKVVDFGYRAVHEMTVQAKAIVAAYYDKRPRYSYWIGCSSGGKQGLKEAQRYPNDYDGIIAGAPANNWIHLMTSVVWLGAATHQDPASFIPPSKYRMMHDAVIQACDATDGLRDGLIDDPRQCHFDPKVLACPGADAPTCLTAPQVEAAKKIYGPATNPRTGQAIFPGLEPGSELGWAFMAGGQEPSEIGMAEFRDIVYHDPNWDWRTFDFDQGVALAEKVDQQYYHRQRSQPEAVFLAWRKTADVPRLDRSADCALRTASITTPAFWTKWAAHPRPAVPSACSWFRGWIIAAAARVRIRSIPSAPWSSGWKELIRQPGSWPHTQRGAGWIARVRCAPIRKLRAIRDRAVSMTPPTLCARRNRKSTA